jgi:hypothetical protein
MARTIRKKSGTGIYHVMLRGINRQDIFEECGQILDIDTDDCKSVSDSDVKAFLLMNQHIVNPLMVQSLEKTRRNGVLRSALSIGAGIRQLSRLTGVSFGIIQKLKNDH